jgi:hypothetical protein
LQHMAEIFGSILRSKMEHALFLNFPGNEVNKV